MSEIITIQVGQCGNQIGSTFWPLVLKEYGILGVEDYHHKKPVYSVDQISSFFHCSSSAQSNSYRISSISDLKKLNCKARCLLIDMEESVVARYKTGPLRSLFDKTCFLTNRPGSGNNWAVGHYEHGTEQKDSITEILRKTAEQCDYLHGFLMAFSLGGGTGSGLGSYILPLLEDQFPAVDRIVACVHPGAYNDVITSPYNIALALRKLSEHASCVFPVDNKALSDICERNKESISKDMKTMAMPYSDINSLIVKMLLNLTSGCRFPGPLNVDLNEIATNMVPFQGLHYLTSSFSPIGLNLPNTNELFQSVINRNNQLLRIDPFKKPILAATLLCRGDISLSDSREFVERFSAKVKQPPWDQSCIKTGICHVPNYGVTKSLLCLTNPVSMSGFFEETLDNFSRLYKKKAHIHHYANVTGFELQEFNLAAETIIGTIEKYSKATKKIDIPRINVV